MKITIVVETEKRQNDYQIVRCIGEMLAEWEGNGVSDYHLDYDDAKLAAKVTIRERVKA